MQLFTFIKDWEVDFIGLAEMSICWQKMSCNQRLWDRTKDWFDNQLSNVANNINEK